MDKARKIVVVLVIIGLGARAFRGNPERELADITEQLQSDFDAGRDRLEEFVDDYPKNKHGWELIGRVYLGIERVGTAEEAFRRALDIDDDMVDAVVGLAFSLQMQGEQTEAQDLYERALRIDPDHANALSRLAVLYAIHQHNKERAIQIAERATELQPDNPAFFANLCLVYHFVLDTEKRDIAATKAERLGFPHMDRIRKMIDNEPTGAEEVEKTDVGSTKKASHS